MIHTPGGLKIRLQEEGLVRVLGDAKDEIDLEDAFTDTELWSIFPGAVSNVAAIVLAVTTRSWLWTALGAAMAFAAAHIAQQIFYSHWLKVLFPQFLGGWLIALPTSLGVAIYLWWTGSMVTGVIAVAVVLLNWLGISNMLLFLLLPARIVIRRLTGRLVGDIELAFIAIVNRQARQRRLQLDWNRYAADR
jgi:hypothetical protein